MLTTPLPLALARRVATLRSKLLWATRSHSYRTPRSAMIMHATTKPVLVRMCHSRKTMQVSMICVFLCYTVRITAKLSRD